MNTRYILVADDEPEVRQHIIHLLQKKSFPHDILQVPNGKLACELALRKKPELIIMDWAMPVMTGIETLSALRSNPETKHIAIIIVSGTMINDVHLKQALETGAADFVRKPLEEVEFLARVRAALSLVEAQKEIKRLHEKERMSWQEKLNQQKRELATQVAYISEQQRALQRLRNQLALNKADQALDLIDELLRNAQYWQVFLQHFEQVHPDFFKRLQEAFPQLTQTDQRMAAYIRMHLNSKEIASLLNLSPKGVESARYRLTKRMKLESGYQLDEYIQNF